MSEELKVKFEALVMSDDKDADYISISRCVELMQAAYNLGKADICKSIDEEIQQTSIDLLNNGIASMEQDLITELNTLANLHKKLTHEPTKNKSHRSRWRRERNQQGAV